MDVQRDPKVKVSTSTQATDSPAPLELKLIFDSTKKAKVKGAHAIGCKN